MRTPTKRRAPAPGTNGAPNIPANAGVVSPAAKLMYINQLLGNKGIKFNQAATMWWYDWLPVDGRTEFNFFENAGAKPFDESNIEAQNGLLSAGEAMALEYIGFMYGTRDAVSNNWTSTLAIYYAGGAFISPFFHGYFEFNTDNMRTLKRVSTAAFSGELNIEGQNFSGMYPLNSLQVIPPLLTWNCKLRVPDYGGAIANAWCGCFIAGMGAILNTKQNY